MEVGPAMNDLSRQDAISAGRRIFRQKGKRRTARQVIARRHFHQTTGSSKGTERWWPAEALRFRWEVRGQVGALRSQYANHKLRNGTDFGIDEHVCGCD